MDQLNTGIYKIENVRNGRIYIGSAVSIKKRWREHDRQLDAGIHHSRFMQRCYNKHGKDVFRFSVLLYCDRENLIDYEQRAIDTFNPDYNTLPTAGSMLGYKHTEETRKKMSESRPKDFSPFTGKIHTDETKRKISKTKTGVKLGKYSRDRVIKTAAAMRQSKSLMLEDDVRMVRRLKSSGLTAKQVADKVGCSHHVVYDICRGRCFGWVK